MNSICHLAFSTGINNQSWEKVGAILYDYKSHTCKVLLFTGYLGYVVGKSVLDDRPPYLHGRLTMQNGSIYIGYITSSENEVYTVKLETIPFPKRYPVIIDVELEDTDEGIIKRETSTDMVEENGERKEDKDKQ